MAENALAPAPSAPNPAPSVSNPSPWLTTSEFAELAGINRQNAHAALMRCLNSKAWRDTALEVVMTEGTGGKGGKVLKVNVASLPPTLHAKWAERYKVSAPVASPPASPVPAPSTYHAEAGKRFAEMRWKLEILGPALDQPPRSRARGEALRTIAGKEYTRPDGKRVKPAYSTLEEWMRKLNTQGETSLPRKRPAPGTPRVIINREWDAACPLSRREQQEQEGALGAAQRVCLMGAGGNRHSGQVRGGLRES